LVRILVRKIDSRGLFASVRCPGKSGGGGAGYPTRKTEKKPKPRKLPKGEGGKKQIIRDRAPRGGFGPRVTLKKKKQFSRRSGEKKSGPTDRKGNIVVEKKRSPFKGLPTGVDRGP